ncbi:ion channel protein, partial [Streptomyces sp. NPDC127091]
MAQDSVQQEPSTAPATRARDLLPTVVPALVVGVAASLLLVGVSRAAEELQDVLWQNLPDALGVGGYSVLWMFVMLVATGIAVGLVVWKVPGHAGPLAAAPGRGAPRGPPRGVAGGGGG